MGKDLWTFRDRFCDEAGISTKCGLLSTGKTDGLSGEGAGKVVASNLQLDCC